jgi:hypothetical protein
MYACLQLHAMRVRNDSGIEEIINLPVLKERFRAAAAQGYLRNILAEIVTQSRVEFNYEDDSA